MEAGRIGKSEDKTLSWERENRADAAAPPVGRRRSCELIRPKKLLLT
jgi:hypothetical protein